MKTEQTRDTDRVTQENHGSSGQASIQGMSFFFFLTGVRRQPRSAQARQAYNHPDSEKHRLLSALLGRMLQTLTFHIQGNYDNKYHLLSV